MWRSILIAVAALGLAGAAHAQTVPPTVPAPADTMPKAPGPVASPGTSGSFMRSDAVLPSLSRSGSATTDASGNINVSFAPLPAPAIVELTYVAPSSATYSCHPTSTPTATGFTANCAKVSYGTLGGDPQRTAIANLVVQWTASN